MFIKLQHLKHVVTNSSLSIDSRLLLKHVAQKGLGQDGERSCLDQANARKRPMHGQKSTQKSTEFRYTQRRNRVQGPQDPRRLHYPHLWTHSQLPADECQITTSQRGLHCGVSGPRRGGAGGGGHDNLLSLSLAHTHTLSLSLSPLTQVDVYCKFCRLLFSW